MMIAPSSQFRDQAQSHAPHRLYEKHFGANVSILKRIFKCLKYLMLHCPETGQQMQPAQQQHNFYTYAPARLQSQQAARPMQG
jgi:hypothetical protein